MFKTTSSSLFLLSSFSLTNAGPSFYKYTPIPTARYGGVGGILYDKYNSPEVWVVGGSNPSIEQQVTSSFEIYSANWDEWKTGSSLTIPRTDHGGSPINGTLYVGGGLTSCDNTLCTTNSVEYYSSTTSSWTSGPSLNIARSGHFFASDDTLGLIYAIGGIDSNSNYLSSVEVFDINTNQWTSIPSMPTPRTGLSAAVVDSKLYVVGGCGETYPVSECKSLSTVEVYDPQTKNWSTLTSLLTPRHSFALGIYGSQLIAAGGSSSTGMAQTGDDIVKSIDIYDLIANEWYLVTRMPDARNGLVKGYNMFVGISMFLISGISSDNVYENTNELMALMCYTEKNTNIKSTPNHPICP